MALFHRRPRPAPQPEPGLDRPLTALERAECERAVYEGLVTPCDAFGALDPFAASAPFVELSIDPFRRAFYSPFWD